MIARRHRNFGRWLAIALACALGAAGLGYSGRAPAATVKIQVMDAVGEGFNDPAPFTPIGGNPATTLGQARLNVFNEAARLWGLRINSAITIVVEARFDPQTCAATTGVLGSAGPTWIFHDFPNAPRANVFYPAALADALAGQNIAGTNGSGTQYGYTDILATFNSTVNGDPTCLGGSYFYYGYDHQLGGHNDGRSYVADLLGVVLHEIGHGLGFISLVDATGAGTKDSGGVARLGIYDQFIYDEGTAMFWPQMSDAQRAQSATGSAPGGNTGLVWNGANVNAHLDRETAGVSAGHHMRLYAPATYDASSSVSHWEPAATPDLLMEPRYSLHTGNHTDLTTCVLYDLGWTGNLCPDILTALAQSVTTPSATPVAITLGAGNADGRTVTFTITTPPAHGTLGAITGAGVTYTPAAGFSGADPFAFQASDGLSTSAAALVTVTVQAAATGGGGGSGGTSGAAAAATSSGGGGALDLATLLALGLAALARASLLRRRAAAAG